VFFAYVDESGNAGFPGFRTYVLGCVLVEDHHWPDTFDRLIEFRRWLRDSFGVPVRLEIKANYLLQNTGPFARLSLSESARFAIYRQAMRLQPKLDLHTFAVLVDKSNFDHQPSRAHGTRRGLGIPAATLERFTTRGNTHLHLSHDEGIGDQIRKWARKARRAGSAGSRYGAGVLKRPFGRLIDDPVSRNSAQSYFVQLADLSAYAAFRRLYPPPARPRQIVPQSMWDELGDARFAPVNMYSGGPTGIVST
jgi:Protein of unknown function (DUF3800)